MQLLVPVIQNVIDNGIALSDVAIDFDSILRPQGAGYDIGAYEYEGGLSCIQGDINCDGVVDIVDLGIVASDFSKTSGFNSKADTDSNNVIDIFDIVFVASRFT